MLKKREASFYTIDLNILCNRGNKRTLNVFFTQKGSKFKEFSGSLTVANESKGGTEINDTHREKLLFIQFSTRMVAWLLLKFFICLHNHKVNYIPSSYIKKCRCLKKVIHQIDSKNKWLLLSASFTAKSELVVVLTPENAFSWRFHVKANRKSIGSSKKWY